MCRAQVAESQAKAVAAVLQVKLDAAGSGGDEYRAAAAHAEEFSSGATSQQRAANIGAGAGAATTAQLRGDLRRAQADLDRLHKLCSQQVRTSARLRRAQTSASGLSFCAIVRSTLYPMQAGQP